MGKLNTTTEQKPLSDDAKWLHAFIAKAKSGHVTQLRQAEQNLKDQLRTYAANSPEGKAALQAVSDAKAARAATTNTFIPEARRQDAEQKRSASLSRFGTFFNVRRDDARRVADRNGDDVAVRLASQRDVFGQFRETFEQLRAVTKDKTATDAEKKEAQSLAARLPKQLADALGDVNRSRFTARDVADATYGQAISARGVSGYGIALREGILTGGGKTSADKTAEYAQKLFDLFNGLVNKGTPITPADLQSIFGN